MHTEETVCFQEVWPDGPAHRETLLLTAWSPPSLSLASQVSGRRSGYAFSRDL